LFDLFKNLFDWGSIHGRVDERIVASIKDSIGDLAANSTGRLGDPRINCNDVCDGYWPHHKIPIEIRDDVDRRFGQ
jgi:hypothetical protein